MGKGLSPLQRAIVEVLQTFPSLEQSLRREQGYIDTASWASPKHIMGALGRPPTDANRATISKALDRLHQRGLIARASGAVAARGKGRRYSQITDPVNAGSDNGPLFVLNQPRIKTVTSGRGHR